jgi:hypothetical protein
MCVRTAVLFTGYLMQLKHLRDVIEHTKLYLQSPRSKRILMICMTASVDHHQLLHLMILLSHHSLPVCVMLRSFFESQDIKGNSIFMCILVSPMHMVEHSILNF